MFGLLLVTFLIARVVPIDPVLAMLGDRASSATYARVRAEMGLDRPLSVQFGRYVAMLAQGDFGRSALTREPVTQDIARFFPATFELATVATAPRAALGVPAGVLAAAQHRSLARPCAAHRVAVRLFRAGVLARPYGALAVLCRFGLGGGAGAARSVAR